ncbi:MAG: crossover junction endodeoxyribonuclease RuvC [Arenicella sp.]
MRVLGIDPGSQIMGVGILDAEGNATTHVFSESLRLPKGELPPRLGRIFQRLDELIAEFKPDLMAIEKVFLAKNPQAALTLGHARGAAILAGVNAGLSVSEYSATQIKKTIVGRGRADKSQVQHMVRVLLNLRSVPEVDESDALACAICHVHHQHSAQLLEKQADLASRMKFQ